MSIELFNNIENQTQTEYISENVEEIIEYLKTVKDENESNAENMKGKMIEKVTRHIIKKSIQI